MIITGRTEKRRLELSKFKEYSCEKCRLEPLWNGDKLTLHIDHINGDRTNNHVDNLRFLCPNCHSQTSTYCARNKKNPTSKMQMLKNMDKSILEELLATKSYSDFYDLYGVPPQVLSKFLRDNKITKPHLTKSRRKVIRPEKPVLITLIKNHSMVKIAKHYGVSDNAVRRWCKYYQIDLSISWGHSKRNAGFESPDINGT